MCKRERETCDVVQSPLVPCTGKEKEGGENETVRNDDDDMSHTSRRNTFCVGEEKETNETPEQKKEKKTRSADREREGGENARSVVAEETETPSASLPWTKKSDIAKKTFGVGREGGPVVKEEEDGEEKVTRGRRGRILDEGGKERRRSNATPMMMTAPIPPTITQPGAVSRPANNQLLYHAKFDWSHYPLNALDEHFLRTKLPRETKACASVMSAFLQIMSAIQTAEKNRIDGRRRNALKLLSTNTRKTKVVALSPSSCSSDSDGSAMDTKSGAQRNKNKNKSSRSNKGGGRGGRGVVLTTHRVSEDLKKHLLQESEDEIEYGTNLDRNRYGTDTDYLHTCIRYNVNSLNLCEKLVNIEIIDCKGGITAAAAMNVSSNSSSSTRKKPMASTLVSSPSSCVRIVREGESKCRCGEINKEIQSMMERKEMFDPTQIVWPQIGKKHGNLGNKNRTKNKNNNNAGTGPTLTTTTYTTTKTMMRNTGAITTMATPRARELSEERDKPGTRKKPRDGCNSKTNDGKLGVLLDALTQVGGIQITPNGTPLRGTKEGKNAIYAEYETQRSASPAAIQPAKDKLFSGTLSLAAERPFASTPPPHIPSIEVAEKELAIGVATTTEEGGPQAIREAIIATTKESIDAVPEESLREDLHNAVICVYERHIQSIVAENNILTKKKFLC